jgi:hypothetical protein
MSLVTRSPSRFHPSRNGVIGPIQEYNIGVEGKLRGAVLQSFHQNARRAEAGHKRDADAVKS